MCQSKSCSRNNCRELAHHGITVPVSECPSCGGEKAGQGHGVQDCTHALGVRCGCGTYYLPASLPADLLATAEPWERGWWSNVGNGAGSDGALVPR